MKHNNLQYPLQELSPNCSTLTKNNKKIQTLIYSHNILSQKQQKYSNFNLFRLTKKQKDSNFDLFTHISKLGFN